MCMQANNVYIDPYNISNTTPVPGLTLTPKIKFVIVCPASKQKRPVTFCSGKLAYFLKSIRTTLFLREHPFFENRIIP
jgi:hypothetical protein